MSTERLSRMYDLTGKVAIITGGGGGIGSVYGEALAECGAKVVLADLNLAAAEAAAAALRDRGHDAIGVAVDITSEESAAVMAQAAVDAFGGIDILVNNAALMTEVPHNGLVDLPLEWFDRVIAVNLKGALICSRAVYRSMMSRGGGRIVNGSSAGGFTAAGAIYGLSKYALHHLTVNLAHELGRRGINVNGIAPGLVENEAGFRALGKDDPVRALVAQGIPGQKSGPSDDLVGTMLLLCSPAGSWINGQTIHVDGGWVTRL